MNVGELKKLLSYYPDDFEVWAQIEKEDREPIELTGWTPGSVIDESKPLPETEEDIVHMKNVFTLVGRYRKFKDILK